MKILKASLILLLIASSFAQAEQQCHCAHLQVCNEDGSCQHKRFLPPAVLEVGGAVFLAAALALCIAAGIGGGALLLPILMAMLSFSEPHAVALSNFLICVGALTRFLSQLTLRHPLDAERPAVDYDQVALLVPPALLGTLGGLHLSESLPEILLVSCLVLTLLVVTFLGFRRACRLCREENTRSANPLKSAIETEQTPRQGPSDLPRAFSVMPEQAAQLDRVLARQRSHCNWTRLAVVWVTVLSLIGMALLRGGKRASLVGLPRCSATDWLLQLIFLLICILAGFVGARLVLRDSNIKQKAGYQSSELLWTYPRVIKFQAVALLAGIVSTALGLGGGVVLMPLLLAQGSPPLAASATSVYVILYVSASSWFQLFLDGQLLLDYALFLGILAAGGTLLGVFLVTRLLRRSPRQSPLLFLLAGLMLAATLLLPVFAVPRALRRSSNIWAFRSPCAR